MHIYIYIVHWCLTVHMYVLFAHSPAPAYFYANVEVDDTLFCDLSCIS